MDNGKSVFGNLLAKIMECKKYRLFCSLINFLVMKNHTCHRRECTVVCARLTL